MRLNLALTCLLLLAFALAPAQDERFGKIGQHSMEVQYVFGRILKHNKKFSPTPTQFTHGVEVSWYKQTLGKKAWQRKLHYPELGASFLFFRHGDNRYFGNAYLFMGVAKFWIVRSRLVDFYVRAASGIAIVPTHFDIIENPTNNVIGSTLNSSAQVKLGIDVKPINNLHIVAGVSFTHYSNSAVQKPNLGVNTPAVFIGLRYFPVLHNRFKYNRDKWPKPDKKNEIMIKAGIGFGEPQGFNGPRFPVYSFSINYARYTSIVNKVLLGTNLEFNQGEYDFALLREEGKAQRLKAGFRFSAFVGDEVLIGKVGLFFIAGFNLYPVDKPYTPYTKIGANYYFVSVGKKKNTKFFVGSNLKSFLFVAQCYEMSTGIAF